MSSLELYSKYSEESSARLTQMYSTSFSIGIRLFSKEIRKPIYALYGFVRMADEIVDSFHGYDKRNLLNQFTEDTFRAIENGISYNPILQSFQQMVRDYKIPPEHIHAFLDSMKMDLDKTIYNRKEYDAYIYGSAEVIGLICLHIFTKGNQNEYDQLSMYAQSLGSAFQKVNFLRDIKTDYKERGRIYFPGMDIKKFDNSFKEQIESEIEIEFEKAFIGIKQLPRSVRLGVFLAYTYYRKLFHGIKVVDAKEILEKRFRVADSRKVFILVKCWVLFRFP